MPDIPRCAPFTMEFSKFSKGDKIDHNVGASSQSWEGNWKLKNSSALEKKTFTFSIFP